MDLLTRLPVVEPESAEAAAQALASAAAEGARIAVRGGGSKIAWGGGPHQATRVLSTHRLSRVLAYAESDLTITCEAGVTLAALNRHVARRRQWLPLESAFDEATIGGMLATNDAGPLRHRFGTPRDLVIGVRLATTDGRVVTAGGQVVKNVAGYDLGKLVTGSFGTLALVASATFKLTPLPAAFGTVRFTFIERAAAAGAAAALAASQLDPLALDVRFHGGLAEKPIELLVRFGAPAAAVELQMAEAERQVTTFGPRTAHRLVDVADEEVWRVHTRSVWAPAAAARPGEPAIVVRVSWLPASLAAVLSFADDLQRRAAAVELIGRAALGAGLLRIEGDARTLVAAARALRERVDLFNQATVLQAPADVLPEIDVWGPPGTAAPLVGVIRRAFDPAGVLSAGQGPS